ncbi:MAG TPA: tetratricopeptide repeat protein, partial [Bryobacteraceae bacterium]
NPANADFRMLLGNLFAAENQTSRAITAYTEAIREKPDYAAAHYNLGLALLKIGDNASAQVHFETAHRLDPSITK